MPATPDWSGIICSARVTTFSGRDEPSTSRSGVFAARARRVRRVAPAGAAPQSRNSHGRPQRRDVRSPSVLGVRANRRVSLRAPRDVDEVVAARALATAEEVRTAYPGASHAYSDARRSTRPKASPAGCGYGTAAATPRAFAPTRPCAAFACVGLTFVASRVPQLFAASIVAGGGLAEFSNGSGLVMSTPGICCNLEKGFPVRAHRAVPRSRQAISESTQHRTDDTHQNRLVRPPTPNLPNSSEIQATKERNTSMSHLLRIACVARDRSVLSQAYARRAGVAAD
jgi:hypothetical protein